MRKTVEIQFDSDELRELFMSWVRDDGADAFADWVYNYAEHIDYVEADMELADSFIISFNE